MTNNPSTDTAPRVFGVQQLEEYLAALNESATLLSSTLYHNPNYTFVVQKGRKYLRIVQCEGGVPSSVHAFVEAATGALIKSAGWSAPQRNSDGSLSVRFDLADDTVRAELCREIRSNPSACHGGYLYER